jgi:hypothetical protein
VPLTVLERVRDGLAALGARPATAPPIPGIHVPASLLPDVFVPQDTLPGGTVWFAASTAERQLAR